MCIMRVCSIKSWLSDLMRAETFSWLCAQPIVAGGAKLVCLRPFNFRGIKKERLLFPNRRLVVDE